MNQPIPKEMQDQVQAVKRRQSLELKPVYKDDWLDKLLIGCVIFYMGYLAALLVIGV